MAFFDFIANADGQIEFGDGVQGIVETHILTDRGQNKFFPLIGAGFHKRLDQSLSLIRQSQPLINSFRDDNVNPEAFEITSVFDDVNEKATININQNGTANS